MLCESGEDKSWRCLVYREGKWIEKGEFDEVQLNRKEVLLPVIGGKVKFDGENCKVVEENGNRILHCEKESE